MLTGTTRCLQIFATTSKGACHILYSPNKSIHGALLPLAKMPKTTPREQVYTSNLPPMIMTPHALPAFKDQDYHQTKRQQEKARMDPVKSHRPMEPVKGAGKGGRVGASATQHLVQHMFKWVTRRSCMFLR
jgi:WD repeat-containing protein 70